MLVAVDVGATKIHSAYFSSGKIVSQARFPTPHKSKAALLSAIKKAISALHATPSSIGVCVPGFVHKGIVYGLPNIGIMRKFSLAAELSKEYKCKVSVQNDSKCFILAEWKKGAAKGAQNALGITFGSGIGGGAIINGKPYEGASNQAAEFGHMKIQIMGIKCPCGGFGCFERYSSGSGIEGIFRHAGGKRLSAKEILGSKERLAVSVSKNTAFIAGIGTASLANIFNPQTIVLGGSVCGAYMGKYKRNFLKGFSSAALPLIKNTKIRKARLQNASLWGAYLLAASASPNVFRSRS
ncbi:ROK family protein [Candidatus Micrarchaeota archaeon]|nr:ROK family protein [Candidatus Micrarchaeota archaeon]